MINKHKKTCKHNKWLSPCVVNDTQGLLYCYKVAYIRIEEYYRSIVGQSKWDSIGYKKYRDGLVYLTEPNRRLANEIDLTQKEKAMN